MILLRAVVNEKDSRLVVAKVAGKVERCSLCGGGGGHVSPVLLQQHPEDRYVAESGGVVDRGPTAGAGLEFRAEAEEEGHHRRAPNPCRHVQRCRSVLRRQVDVNPWGRREGRG